MTNHEGVSSEGALGSRVEVSHPDSIRIRLKIAYDGTAYAGWQVQKIGLGIQQLIETAIAKLFGLSLRIHGSSRTDTGVHAIGMVAHLDIPLYQWKMTPSKLVLALNANLPTDIRILGAGLCTSNFHARFDAKGKQYRYFVWNHPVAMPLLRSTTWHVPKPLDFSSMSQASKFFIGTHDFKSFAANRSYEMESNVRTLFRCSFHRRGSLLTFVMEGDGFLYKMCRGIVGTLVQVGLGKISPSEISNILDKKDRRIAGMNAPAHGLVLWRVFYRKRRKSI